MKKHINTASCIIVYGFQFDRENSFSGFFVAFLIVEQTGASKKQHKLF